MHLSKFLIIIFIIGGYFICPAQNSAREECNKIIQEGIALMLKKEHTQSLELLVLAKGMASDNDWYYEKFLATNNIGANYHLMSDSGEAIKHYLQAYEIATQKLEPINEMTILNNIAILYFYERDYIKSHEFFLLALEVAVKENNPLKQGHYEVNLAMVANKLKHLDEARDYINSAFPKVENDQRLFIQAKLAQIENLFLRGEYAESERQLKELYPRTKAPEYQDFRQMLLMFNADIHEQRNDFESALNLTLEASKIFTSIQNKINIFESLAHLYESQNYYEAALQYKDSIITAQSDLNESIKNNLYESSKVKFDIQNYQRELSESKIQLASERKTFYITFVCVAILIIFLAWNFWNISIKYRQRKTIAELELEKKHNETLFLEQQFKEKEALAQLEQQKLKNEIESKNRKLTAKALQLSSRNELIEEIVNNIAQQLEISGQNQLKNNINKLKSHLKKDTQWDNFFTHFEEVNKGFLERLREKHPDLIPSEIRFLCYVYMNLTSKEISSLLNISNQAVRKRKERLSTKLQLANNQNIDSYVSGF